LFRLRLGDSGLVCKVVGIVGGDGAEDVGSVELEVSEVGVDGGAGVAELCGDVVWGASLAVEVVGM